MVELFPILKCLTLNICDEILPKIIDNSLKNWKIDDVSTLTARCCQFFSSSHKNGLVNLTPKITQCLLTALADRFYPSKRG